LLKQKLDYKECVNLFQNTDIDPRELILLFKDLYETSTSLRKMVQGVPTTYLRAYMLQNIMQNSNSSDIDKKHKEGKEAIRNLLEILNKKYINELRKDPNKEAEFMESQFSDIH